MEERDQNPGNVPVRSGSTVLAPTSASTSSPLSREVSGEVSGDDATIDGTQGTGDAATQAGRDAPGLMSTFGGRGPSLRELAPGTRIASFIVERKLGAGAMGVVLLARDPELARPVAIKLMASSDGYAHQRLLREAQAAAHLAHPNVVAVHQAGLWNEQVFVVMEYVDGGTLREWLKATPRPWPEVLAAFVQAGQGLVAAHAAGLVHRDFKPDNVLVGRSGRVRVSDFGLVGASGSIADTELSSGDGPSLDVNLTRTGALLGTPAYMAPEQFHGARVDAKADQFAFCVALFEGLYGKRPFGGTTPANLLFAMSHGQIEAAPPSAVPPAIHRAIVQGLSANPDARHPSVAALLTALQPAAVKKGRGALVGGVILGVVALAGGVVVLAMTQGVTVEASLDASPVVVELPVDCTLERAALGGVWNDARRGALRETFAATGHAWAPAMFESLAAHLDAYTNAWMTMREHACQAAEIDKNQSAEEYALRKGCLDDRRADVEVLLAVLGEEGPTMSRGALETAALLGSIDRCGDLGALRNLPPAPTDAATVEALEAVRRASIRARLLVEGGRPGDALPILEAAVELARALEYEPMLVRVLLLLARVQSELGSMDTEPLLRDVARLAANVGDHQSEAGARIQLLRGLARESRTEELTEAIGSASAAVKRAQSPREAARLLHEEAILAVFQGDLALAAEKADAAIAALTAITPTPALQLSRAHVVRAATHIEAQQFEQARAEYDKGRVHLRALFGDDHPDEGKIYMGEAALASQRGDLKAAVAAYQQAVATFRAAYGPHALVYEALKGLYNLHAATGDPEAARRVLEEAVAVTEARGSEGTREQMADLQVLEQLAESEQRYDDARAYLIRMRAVGVALGLGPADLGSYDLSVGALHQADQDFRGALPWFHNARKQYVLGLGNEMQAVVANADTLLGNTYQHLGECEAATAHYGDALNVRATLRMGADLLLAQIHIGMARCEVARGDHAAADASLRHADEVLDLLPPPTASGTRPFVDLGRARLRHAQGRTEEARTLAQAARDQGSAFGGPYLVLVAEAQAVLDAL